MARSSSRRGIIDAITILILLGGAAFVMYGLLPSVTPPNQAVVPPLPPSASDPTQIFLTLFIVATTIGAPITGGIILALLFRWLSKSVPAQPLTIPPGDKPAARPATEVSAEPRELSPREALFWKILATLLVLGALAVVTWAMWPDLVRLFS